MPDATRSVPNATDAFSSQGPDVTYNQPLAGSGSDAPVTYNQPMTASRSGTGTPPFFNTPLISEKSKSNSQSNIFDTADCDVEILDTNSSSVL